MKITLTDIFIFYLCIHTCLCAYIPHVYNAFSGQKRISDPLELELEVVVRPLIWVLKRRSSGKESIILDY